MNYLKLNFNKKEYPYTDKPYDHYIVWGEITLSITSSQVTQNKEVVKLQWDLRALITWILENKSRILYDDFLLNNSDTASIAKQIYNFYNKQEELNELLIDSVFEYRQSHGIRFGLRGTNVDDVYIGLNGNKHEISFYSEADSWQFTIDLVNFFEDIEREYFFISK